MDNQDSPPPPSLPDFGKAMERIRTLDAEAKAVREELLRRRDDLIRELKGATDLLDVGKMIGAISELQDLADAFDG